jgi:hypothetical protein
MGFAGLLTYTNIFKNSPQLRFSLSVILGGAFRFISHVLAGTFAFGAYSLDSGLSPFVYSLGYNSYVFVDVALILIAGCTTEESNGSTDKENSCGYKYTYTCGFNIMTGRTECNYGYYYVCY